MQQLKNVYPRIKDIVKLHYVPFGKAYVSKNIKNQINSCLAVNGSMVTFSFLHLPLCVWQERTMVASIQVNPEWHSLLSSSSAKQK